MPPLLMRGVSNTCAIIEANQGVIAGDELPFTEVVLRRPLHSGCGIDRAQHFLSEHPWAEHNSAFHSRHGGRLPFRVDDGHLALGSVGAGTGHDEPGHTYQRAIIGYAPARREAGDDMPEVLDDPAGTQTLNDRVGIAHAFIGNAVILTQLSVVKEQFIAGLLTNHQRIDRARAAIGKPPIAVGSISTFFAQNQRSLVQHVLGKSATGSSEAAHVHSGTGRLSGSVTGDIRYRPAAMRVFRHVIHVDVLQPVGYGLHIALLQRHEVLLPEVQAVPVDSQVILTDQRPTQAKALGLVGVLLEPNVGLVVRGSAGADIGIATSSGEGGPGFLVSGWLRAAYLKGGFDKASADLPLATGNQIEPWVLVGGAEVKLLAEELRP